MRVKTVPKHRATRSNGCCLSDNAELTAEHSDDSSVSDDEKNESLKYMLDALEVSDRYKMHPLRTTLLNRQDAPMIHQYPRLSPGGYLKDSNNNNWVAHSNFVDIYSMAGPSNDRYSELSTGMISPSTSVNDSCTMTALNLSKKDSPKVAEDNLSTTSPSVDDKMKDSFLYKIMTDPTFLENIQKSKYPKKYMCQFCKQEFGSGSELFKHMEVKKDESNQVICCACKKTFSQKRYLRYHQRCHSERTKFTCDICTKKYTRLDNLTRHNVFHVNPDKFSCPFCEKTFARKDLLNKHQKCHDNKYRFFCESCQKYFKGPVTLENHKSIFHPVL